MFNKKNLSAIDELIAPNHLDHSAGAVGSPVGPEGSRQLIGMMLTAFPDMHVTVEDMIAEGNKVVVRFTERGTQQGAFGSIPQLASRWRSRPSILSASKTARSRKSGALMTCSACSNNSVLSLPCNVCA